MEEFFTKLQDVPPTHMALVIGLMLVVWFLPVGLAMIFNRRQAKLVAIACVPAGLSVFAWSAVMVWAVTGKAAEKYLPKKVLDRL